MHVNKTPKHIKINKILGIKKQLLTDVCDNMDEPSKHYASLSEKGQDTQGHRLYKSIYMDNEVKQEISSCFRFGKRGWEIMEYGW